MQPREEKEKNDLQIRLGVACSASPISCPSAARLQEDGGFAKLAMVGERGIDQTRI